jgi:NADH-quinone oxidoreductase subunit L
VPNYFERTLEPVVAPAPERGGAAEESIGAGRAAENAEPPQMLSRPPQQIDGASPLSVGAGAQGEPVHERAPTDAEVRMERLFTLISLLVAITGIGIGILVFEKRPLLALPRILEEKYYVDEIYDAAIINPIKAGSREGLWRLFDVGVIDGLVNGLGRTVREVGDGVRRVQFGFVRSYAAIILLGALAVIGYFVFSFARNLR